MRIGFDIDGVLANFSAVAIDEIRKSLLPDLPADYVETSDWNYCDILQPGQFDGVFERLLKRDQFWTTLPANTSAVEALRDYTNSHGEDEIFYITSRPDCESGSAHSMTQLWLMDQGLDFKNLIVVKSSKEKEGHIRQNGIKMYIDDLPSTIKQLVDAGHNALLLDRPYNQGADLPRVFSVGEFLLQIEMTANS